MLTVEALEILALRPGANPSEIKEAYRDLVKVWHPDRFGNDARLREKAELQLKRINEAYRILQSDAAVEGLYGSASEGASGFSPRNTASSGASGRGCSASRVPWKGRGRSGGDRVSGRWIYGGLGLAAILVATYFIGHDRMHGAGLARDAAARQSAGMPIEQTREASPGGSVVHSTDSNGAGIQARGVGRPRDASARQFQVRSLSEAETDRVEMLCSRQRQVSGQVAYQSCLKAQLDVITNPAGKPDLTALRTAERESIESVCSEARRLRGRDGYNRCATEQVASLAAEPARPDVSTLSDVDRHSIESVCATEKVRDGPAAYNRCVDRMMRTLAEAR